MDIGQTLALAAPELILAIGAMALLIGGVFGGDQSRPLVGASAIALLLAALAVAIANLGQGPQLLFDGAFRSDAFANFSKALIFAAAAIAIFITTSASGGEDLQRFEYPILIVLAALGMSMMVSANDLIALYMGVETQSLALYVLAAFNRDSRRSTEAGLKYFVLGALSSCLLLYGASLVYGFTGATGYEAIAAAGLRNPDNQGLAIGLVFLIAGLAFKASAAPFHMWTPDVYEGAPTPVTAFFAAAPKFAAIAVFIRIMIEAFPAAADDWRLIVGLLASASMAVGAFSAIVQSNIKRLMAYSSIGHMGFALIGLAAAGTEGVRATLVYMTIYLVMTVGAFACILLMRRRGGLTELLSDLAGLSRSNIGLCIILTVLLFSLAGVPPTAGFLAKFFVFRAAVDAGMVWLAVIGALMSVVSAYYYLRVVWIMWFNEPTPVFEREIGARIGVIAAGSALLMLPGLLIFIGPLSEAAGRAAAVLF